MSQRDTNLLWLKDTLRHMTACQEQLAWATDADSIQVLTENLLRDTESCRRLCEAMLRQTRQKLQHA